MGRKTLSGDTAVGNGFGYPDFYSLLCSQRKVEIIELWNINIIFFHRIAFVRWGHT